jgi:Cu/Ag efflux protein CusF
MALLCLSACHRTQTSTPGKRYHFTGRIISLDPRSESAFIYGDEIPGFMGSMGMSYKIKPSATLDKLTPGDVISADVVVQQPNPKDESAESDYWLENVKVTGHVKPTAKPTMWRGHPCPRLPLTANACATVSIVRGAITKNSCGDSRPRLSSGVRLRGLLASREDDTILWALSRV